MNIPKALFFLTIFFLPLFADAQKNKKEKDDDGQLSQKEIEAEATFIEGMKSFIAENYTDASKFFKTCIEKNANNAGALYMLAKSSWASGDLAGTVPNLEKAVKIDESNKYYQTFLAEVYTKQKRYKDAADIYQKLSKEFPRDIDNYLSLSNIYLLQEKYTEAVEVYDKIERTIGVSEEITHQKQLIYLKQNKVDKALEEGGRLMNSEPLEPEYILQQAQILISNERPDQAVSLLEKAIKANPDLAEAHILLAEVYRKQNNLKKCNEELTIAFANKNLAADVKVKILSSYLLMMQNDNSPETLDNLSNLTQQLQKQSPDNAKNLIILGDLYRRKENFEESRKNYVAATKYDKSVFEVWVAILEMDNKLNQMDSLVKHSEEAIEYFPEQTFLWYNNGVGHYLKKDFNKSVAALEEARNLAADNKEMLLHINSLLGDAYNENKEYKKSDDAFEAVLKQDPINEHVLNNYSYFLSLRKQNLSRALELSTILVDRYKDSPSYLDTHAWVLYVNKDYKKAKEFLEKALSISENNGTIIEHYGDVLFQLGEKEKALEQWKKAKTKGETSTLLDKKIQQGILIE